MVVATILGFGSSLLLSFICASAILAAVASLETTSNKNKNKNNTRSGCTKVPPDLVFVEVHVNYSSWAST